MRHTVYLNDILPGPSSKLSHYEKRTGLAPKETPSKIEGVLFCKAVAKLYTKGKLERTAIDTIYLGKDPISSAKLVRVMGGKISGVQIRRAEVVSFDITNFPYANLMVPGPPAFDSKIYGSDSELDTEDEGVETKESTKESTTIDKDNRKSS